MAGKGGFSENVSVENEIKRPERRIVLTYVYI
jgi:hypothetical protein